MENVSSSNGLELYPKLRFKNDSGTPFPNWKVEYLKNILVPRNQKQIPSTDAPLMAFIANKGVADKGERYDRSYLVKSNDKLYKLTELNDFIYSSNNLDVGSIGLNTYGKAVISDVYEIFYFTPLGIPSVINEIIQLPQNLNKIIRYRQGCLYGQYRIYAEDFLKTTIIIPTVDEQKKISHFIHGLDERIKKQESLIKNLKKYKRGLVSLIWTGKWNKKKLSELLEFQNGINASSEKYGKGIKYISVSDILDEQCITYSSIRGLVDVDNDTIEHYSVSYGDVLFQRSSENREDAGKCNIYIDKEHTATFGGFVIRGKKKADYDPMYIKYALSTEVARKQITSHAAGAQHINIGQKSLETVLIEFPSISIQTRIGELF